MRYTVYFEIYGKKMRSTVSASSQEEAVAILKSKLKIHKMKAEVPEPPKYPQGEIWDILREVTGRDVT